MGTFVDRVFDNNAANVVQNGISDATVRAEDALDTALDFLGDLERLASRWVIFRSTIDLDPVLTDDLGIQFPKKPDAPAFTLTLPNFPSDISLNPVPALNLPTAPTFDEPVPNLLFPEKPAPLDVTTPGDAPTTDLEVVFPDAPDTTLPAVPTLRELDIPPAPTVVIPSFTEALPDPILSRPQFTFAFSEDPYASSTLTAVTNSLLERIQGGTGIPVDIESQIWDRARNRERVSEDRSREDLLFTNAQTGFSRPTGSSQAALDLLAQETQNKISDFSREVAIKQADLEQKNLESTISGIISLEQLLIGHFNDIQNRSLDTAKFAQQVSIDIYNTEVARFQVELESYKAFSVAFEAQVRAEISKVDIYKAEIQAQGLINDINNTDVQLFATRVDAINSAVQVYKTEIQAIGEQVNVEQLKLQAYKTEVDAFSSLVASKGIEFSTYSEQVKAESIKFDAFDSQVKAFTSRIQAYATQVDAEKTVSDARVSQEDLKVKQQALKLDTYSKTVQAEISAYQTQVAAFQGVTSMYSAEVGAESARLSAEIQTIGQRITHAKAKADVAVANANVNIANLEASNSATLEAAKAGATVSSQLASSSLAGMRFSAGVSHSLGLDNSLSETHKVTEV